MWKRVRIGDDLSLLRGVEGRFWAYTASHDQLFVDLQLGSGVCGVASFGGCFLVKLTTSWRFHDPALEAVVSEEEYYKFFDLEVGIENICRGMGLDLEVGADSRVDVLIK